jgi:tellurite resistance protein
LFLLFGTKGVRTGTGRGQFTCPRCRATREYRAFSVQRHAHLFFIPVVPIGSPAEYVECGSCHATFVPEVLTLAASASQEVLTAEFQKAMVAIMIAVGRADGRLDEVERDRIGAVYQQIASCELAEDLFQAEMRRVTAWRFNLKTVVSQVRQRLNDHGRELVLRSAALIALADGRLQPKERDMLLEIARDLEMTRAHMRGVFAEVGIDL